MPDQKIQIVLEAKDKTKQAFSSASRGMDKLRAGINSHAASIGLAMGVATTAIVSFANKSIEDASNLGESINAVNVTFGEASQAILDFGKTAATTAGLSMRALNDAAVPIGAQLQNMGFEANKAAEETIKLSKRAADIASVFNVDLSDALAAIQSGLRGQTEPLTRFGVDLTEAQIKAVALKEGIIETDREMTQQEKTLARLAALYSQTAQVEGDFINTSDQLANSQRILAAELENQRAKLGEELLPLQLEWVQFQRNTLVPFITDYLIPALHDMKTGVGVVKEGWDAMTTSIANVMIKFDQLKAKIPSVKEAIGGLMDAFGPFMPGGAVGGAVIGKIFDKFFAEGGIVPGSGAVPIMAHGGEMVLNQGQQQKLFEMLDGPRTSNFNFGGITINNNADGDRFIRNLQQAMGGNVESAKMGLS